MLGGLAASAFACRREPQGAPPTTDEPPPLPPPVARVSAEGGAEPVGFVRRELSLPGSMSPRVIALVPRTSELDGGAVQVPVVIALHGRGEARKGPTRGPLGWPDDYALERAMDRIAHPPLERDDFFGLVTPDELAAHNRQLAATPFRGLVVLCPYLPDLDLGEREPQDAYGRFLIDVLLPRAREAFAILPGREHVGIDGISLGGEVALHAGARFPEAFGAVSGMQPAIGSKDASGWARRLAEARQRVGSLALRLQTSQGDPFKKPTRRLSEELTKLQVEHTLVETPGPHDYVYNRGPAAYGLLGWHDRVLR